MKTFSSKFGDAQDLSLARRGQKFRKTVILDEKGPVQSVTQCLTVVSQAPSSLYSPFLASILEKNAKQNVMLCTYEKSIRQQRTTTINKVS